jgi:hypothetical protein
VILDEDGETVTTGRELTKTSTGWVKANEEPMVAFRLK